MFAKIIEVAEVLARKLSDGLLSPLSTSTEKIAGGIFILGLVAGVVIKIMPFVSSNGELDKKEIGFWEWCENQRTKSACDDYLKEYPNGAFKSLAEKIVKIADSDIAFVSDLSKKTHEDTEAVTLTKDWHTVDRYLVKEGLVKDTKTGLIWMRCSLGQQWNGITCDGKAEKYNWDDAIKSSNGFNSATYSDWRVPTFEELKTLVYCSGGMPKKWNDTSGDCSGDYFTPTIFAFVFPNTLVDGYWSSSFDYKDDNYAWVVSFIFGHGNHDPKYWGRAVRLVRRE